MRYFPFIFFILGFAISCSGPGSSSATKAIEKQIKSGANVKYLKKNIPYQPVMLGGQYVRATGNEPFWMLELKEDSAIFKLLGGNEYHELLPPPSINTPDSLRYSLKATDGTTLDVLVTNHPCVDNMSGFKKRFTTAVVVTQGSIKNFYEGCADYLSEYNKVMEVDQ